MKRDVYGGFISYRGRRQLACLRAGLFSMLEAFVAVMVVLFVLASCVPRPAHAAPVTIPATSAVYRIKLEREAGRMFGLNAPVARLAAQIHQESGWRPHVASAYAEGLTQFTPATAKWIPSICPEIGAPDPWNPYWSIDAQVCYMAWLRDRVVPYRPGGALSECSRWAFALRAYNGGEGWLARERSLARKSGDDANDWLRVAHYRARAPQFFAESIGYPRRILLVLEPAYRNAGWPGEDDCA